MIGWGTRIRTLIDGVRVRSLAIRPFPSECISDKVVYLDSFRCSVKKK